MISHYFLPEHVQLLASGIHHMQNIISMAEKYYHHHNLHICTQAQSIKYICTSLLLAITRSDLKKIVGQFEKLPQLQYCQLEGGTHESHAYYPGSNESPHTKVLNVVCLLGIHVWAHNCQHTRISSGHTIFKTFVCGPSLVLALSAGASCVTTSAWHVCFMLLLFQGYKSVTISMITVDIKHVSVLYHDVASFHLLTTFFQMFII